MSAPITSLNPISSAWEVFVLFAIPVGGGIPAGVLLARSRGLRWPVMTVLYFISDLALACAFEPIMRVVIAVCQRSPRLLRGLEAVKKAWEKNSSRYQRSGRKLGVVALILISFGVDPMTGRAAARAAGHGFVAGDMLYFLMLMVSTLWLSAVLGDGTWATVIILLITMIGSHLVVRRVPVEKAR
jgi:hypothetical protein